VIVAAPPGHEDEVSAAAPGEPEVLVVAGGASRSESVAAALVQAGSELVAVHDAARPLVTPELIDRLAARLLAQPGAAGVIAATPIVDTVKRVDESLEIVGTEKREGLWAAQTPQVFRTAALRAALDASPERLAAATDEAMLIEWAGGRVLVEPAETENPKLTNPADLERIELLLGAR
jgi:2-C-methyl-D-erythritol 4-phosphate cytidylyltransferase